MLNIDTAVVPSNFGSGILYTFQIVPVGAHICKANGPILRVDFW